MKPLRVAVTSRSFSKHPVLRAELLAHYPDAVFNDAGTSLTGDQLVLFLAGCERAIVALERVDDELLAAVPSLRVISKYGVGLDAIDVAAMQRRGVALGWTPGVNRRSVAELAIAFAISLLHRVPQASSEARAGGWRQLVGRQLTGRTVGIIGCGHVGKEVVLLARAFGCRVLAHDIRDYPEFYAAHGVEPVSLESLLGRSEVVTLHVPLDDSTRLLLNAERIRAMREGAVLINTARGGIVDEAAVADALDSGRLAGAAFDVFATEPPHDSRLMSISTFIATPHIGGSSEEAVLAMGRAAIAGLESAREPVQCVPELFHPAG
jgi:phosphoglycerate dehydrogenase-like enzyme